MIKLARNREIRRLRKTGKKTLVALGKKYKVSFQRIQKIVDQIEQYCKKHKNYYYSHCVSCTKNAEGDRIFMAYRKTIKKLIDIIRSDKSTIKDKVRCTKTLKDKYKLSFPKIGLLTGRHHTTIFYYYNKT